MRSTCNIYLFETLKIVILKVFEAKALTGLSILRAEPPNHGMHKSQVAAHVVPVSSPVNEFFIWDPVYFVILEILSLTFITPGRTLAADHSV